MSRLPALTKSEAPGFCRLVCRLRIRPLRFERMIFSQVAAYETAGNDFFSGDRRGHRNGLRAAPA